MPATRSASAMTLRATGRRGQRLHRQLRSRDLGASQQLSVYSLDFSYVLPDSVVRPISCLAAGSWRTARRHHRRSRGRHGEAGARLLIGLACQNVPRASSWYGAKYRMQFLAQHLQPQRTGRHRGECGLSVDVRRLPEWSRPPAASPPPPAPPPTPPAPLDSDGDGCQFDRSMPNTPRGDKVDAVGCTP